MYKIGFIGSGRMASCLIHALLETKKYHITVVNPSGNFSSIPQGVSTSKTYDSLSECHLIVLAVKPQSVENVATFLPKISTLLVSVVAGYSSAKLEQLFGTKNIIRAMPNTPAIIKKSSTAMWASHSISAESKQRAHILFAAVGSIVWLEKEHHMQVATAISGSAPAYYYLFTQSIIESGIKLGLTRQQATDLVLPTGLGSCLLAHQSDSSLPILIEEVKSPKGTTEQAMYILEKHLPKIVDNAVKAAFERAEELGK